MKFKKTVGLLLILALMAMMMIGCAESETNQQPSEQTPSQPAGDTTDPDATKATATYTGRIDNNSVEMDLQGSPLAFQLTEDMMETWDNLGFAEGDQLEIQYQEREDDRPLLLKVDKKEARREPTS